LIVRRTDAGTVDEHPERAHVDGRVDGHLNLVGLRDVGMHIRSTDLGGNSVAQLVVEIEDHDRRAVGGEAACGSSAEARGAPGDDG
jgi:hypothetical protein